MTQFAYLAGYFFMGASTIAACILVCGLLADSAYRTFCKLRSFAWMARAMRHYSEIEPPPKRGGK